MCKDNNPARPTSKGTPGSRGKKSGDEEGFQPYETAPLDRCQSPPGLLTFATRRVVVVFKPCAPQALIVDND